jgi:hypothetical protein
MSKTETILSIVNWFFIYMALFVYGSIFAMILRCRREVRDISLLLTCNTCLSALFTCSTVFVMICSNLFGGFLLINMNLCYVWGLLYDIFECSIYHSYCLHAIYRLCRIVFFKRRALVSLRLYTGLIAMQWLWVLLLLLPPLFLGWYARLSTENVCLIPYSSTLPELYHILVLYLIPLSCICVTYVWITRFMRGSLRGSIAIIAAFQRQRNQRDLTVIKRIVIIVSILVILRFPTIIFVIYEILHGSLYPLTYPIVGVIASVCLTFVGLITIYVTTQLRQQVEQFLCLRNNRIEASLLRSRQLELPPKPIVPLPITTNPLCNRPTTNEIGGVVQACP